MPALVLQRMHGVRTFIHNKTICLLPFSQYYIQNVNERKVKVKCPDPTCTEELHFRNMKDIIDYKYILKFQRFSLADNPPPEDTKNRHIWFVLDIVECRTNVIRCPGIECKTKIIKNKVNVARAFEDSEVKCPKCLLVVSTTDIQTTQYLLA